MILDRLDPSRGLPPTPGPLPEVEIELADIDLGPTPLPELDVGTAVPDSVAAR